MSMNQRGSHTHWFPTRRMPALEELYLAGVPIAAVLREMHELSKSGTALPPIKCLDVVRTF